MSKIKQFAKRTRNWLDRNGLNILIVVLVVFFLVVFFWRSIFVTVPAGNTALLFSPFNGGTQTTEYSEGMLAKWPWDDVFLYDTRIQFVQDTITAQSKNGLSIEVIYTMRFKPKVDRLSDLHKFVGPDYARKLVIPEAVTKIREIVSRFSADQLYSMSESEVQNELLVTLKTEVGDRLLLFEDIKIHKLVLPESVMSAIESKEVEKQKAEEYEYRLTQEDQEVSRKKKEAEGIAEFERISGIKYLEYRGIQATEHLSASPNSKVIIMGSGKGQLPVLLSDK